MCQKIYLDLVDTGYADEEDLADMLDTEETNAETLAFIQ